MNHRSQEAGILFQLAVKGFIFDHIQFVIFVYVIISILLVNVVEHVSQRSVTILVDYESPWIHYGIGVHFQQTADSLVVLKLFFWLTSFKEIVAEPDFCQMGLIFVGGVDLLDSIK